MYNEEETKRLSKAVIKLMRKLMSDIRLDKNRVALSLLTLRSFTYITFNNPEKCKRLVMLIKSDMWSTFGVELRNEKKGDDTV